MTAVFRSIFSSFFKDLITAFISKATGNWNVDGEITWEQPGFPEAGDAVQILATHIISLIRNEAAASVLINATGQLDIATFNLILSSAINNNGTLKIGTSADKGLELSSLALNSGSTFDMALASLIKLYGNYSCHDSTIFANNYRGELTLAKSGTWKNQSSDNRWYKFFQNAGLVTTVNAGNGGRFTSSESHTTVINGTIAMGGYFSTFGAFNTFTFGVNSDLTGSGIQVFLITNATTYTNNKVGTFSTTGSIRMQLTGSGFLGLTGDFRNAGNYSVFASTSSNRDITFAAGTLICGPFEVTQSSTGNITVINTVNNPDFNFLNNVDLNNGSGVYLTIWQKGGGTIKLGGTNPSIDLNGQNVEVIWSSTNIGNVTILSADTWDIDTLDLITTVLTVNGTLKIGATAATGFSNAGILLNSGSVFDGLINSKIINIGNYFCHNSVVFAANRIGDYVQAANGTYESDHNSNNWYNFKINVGVTLTFSTGTPNITTTDSNNTVIDGIAATDTLFITFGGAGLISFGANSDFTGNGTLVWTMRNTITFTNNKTGAFSFSGVLQFSLSGIGAGCFTGNWSNANAKIISTLSAARVVTFSIGLLQSIDFDITNSSTGQITVINSANDPSFSWTGNVDFNDGSFTTVWTRGTGTITLPGGSANIDFNGQTIERLIISGATKTILAAFTTASMLVSGTLDLNSIGTVVVEGDLDGNGTIQSPTPVNLTVNGNNNFTGTLTNVTII